MRTRAWGLLLLAPGALAVAVVATAPYLAFHPDLALAGTPGRVAATVVRAGRSDARAALWLESAFALVWLAVVPALLRAGRDRWAPEHRAARGGARHAATIALAAGCTNLAGNVIALAMVGKQRPPTWMALPLTVIGWATIALFTGAIVGLIGLVIAPLTTPMMPLRLRRGGDWVRAQVARRPLMSGRWSPAGRGRSDTSPGGGHGVTSARLVASGGWTVAVTVLVAAAVGRFVTTRVVHPEFPDQEVVAEPLGLLGLLPARLVVPPLVLVGIGLVVLVVERRRTRAATAASLPSWLGLGSMVSGAVVAALVVVAPGVLLVGRRLLAARPLPGGPAVAATLILIAAVAVIASMRWHAGPARSSGARWDASWCAGLIARAAVAFAVADSFAYDEAPLWSAWPVSWMDSRVALVLVAAAWVVAVPLLCASIGEEFRQGTA